MEKNTLLIQVYTKFFEDEKFILEKIKNPENIYHYAYLLGLLNIVPAIHAMYKENNYSKAKNILYTVAKASEYVSFKFDQRIIDNGLKEMSYALLSDNKDLISTYSTLKNTINHETGIGYQLPNSIQNILLEDWDKLDWNIRCLGRFVKMPRFICYSGVVEILNGFKQHDASLIQIGLEQFLSYNKKRADGDDLIYQFISFETAGFNKLAWMKGYEIDLQTTLVPIELMPVKPLENYKTYDFLYH